MVPWCDSAAQRTWRRKRYLIAGPIAFDDIGVHLAVALKTANFDDGQVSVDPSAATQSGVRLIRARGRSLFKCMHSKLSLDVPRPLVTQSN